jgi:hypothetical protein
MNNGNNQACPGIPTHKDLAFAAREYLTEDLKSQIDDGLLHDKPFILTGSSWSTENMVLTRALRELGANVINQEDAVVIQPPEIKGLPTTIKVGKGQLYDIIPKYDAPPFPEGTELVVSHVPSSNNNKHF